MGDLILMNGIMTSEDKEEEDGDKLVDRIFL
jgi:hypothetical protein